jgi:hypothetical protein
LSCVMRAHRLLPDRYASAVCSKTHLRQVVHGVNVDAGAWR